MRPTTPKGFRDILPNEALARERIIDSAKACFAAHGYLPVETPLLEDKSSIEQAGRIQDSPFQLFDTDDRLLILRPDLTLPIARMASARIRDEELPMRFRYVAPVVRESGDLKGQPRQFTQLGVELIGEEGVTSELEVIHLLAELLSTLKVSGWKIVCGSVKPLLSLLETCAPNENFLKEVLDLVHESDLVGLDKLVQTADVSEAAKAALKLLPQLHGGVNVIDELDRLLAQAGVERKDSGIDTIRQLLAGLSDELESGRLSFDFSIINSFDYYTGIIFKAYSDQVAASLASGGHYDAVFANLGRNGVGACGFACSLERLQEAIAEHDETSTQGGANASVSGMAHRGVRMKDRPLRIAIPKGSLFKPTLEALAGAGLDVSALDDIGRRLIIQTPEVDYVIVRAQDTPAFVAYGGADCGICGYDSLVEANIELIHLVDLGFGWCKFIVAEPEAAAGQAEQAYEWRGSMRVVTKYPRITQAYYDRIGQQVDIIKLHGNIELGPIIGMADRIVDITATGTTLAENNLVVVDDVMECTARFFTSPAAYRSDPRIRALADKLQDYVGDVQ
ncbi:MAG: ATP phosphoribosyltransferase [Atopobiaceae bacterium]|nr:ATP phosphoribosyltransferase [Atopobiaceae bacterium]